MGDGYDGGLLAIDGVESATTERGVNLPHHAVKQTSDDGERVRRGRPMTEAEWLPATDPKLMLEFLRGKASDRKLRLFACACCRRIWDFITREESRRAVEITEQSADGPVAAEVLAMIDFDSISDDCGPPEEPYRTAYMVAGNVGYNVFGHCEGVPHFEEFDIAKNTAETTVMSVGLSRSQKKRSHSNAYQAGEKAERVAQTILLRDIFGNPFRKVTLNPAWLTSTVLALATGIYDERAFDRMPILADALQDAGCDNAEILNHCREPGEHVKGCWVVDLLLDKK